MEARLHDDLAEFHALTGELFTADPVANTVALTVVDVRLRVPASHDQPPVLLTVHDGSRLAGAALATPPLPLIVSALPPACAGAAADALAGIALGGAVGPRPEAAAFAHAWRQRNDVAVRERLAQRLFALGALSPPRGVPGAARRATTRDVDVLAGWRETFAAEASGGLRGAGSALHRTDHGLPRVGRAWVAWEACLPTCSCCNLRRSTRRTGSATG